MASSCATCVTHAQKMDSHVQELTAVTEKLQCMHEECFSRAMQNSAEAATKAMHKSFEVCIEACVNVLDTLKGDCLKLLRFELHDATARKWSELSASRDEKMLQEMRNISNEQTERVLLGVKEMLDSKSTLTALKERQINDELDNELAELGI